MAMMTGGQAVLEVLVSEGTEYLFANPGSTAISLHDALHAYPQIKYIMGLQENIPVGMADGYARASGKIGVVNVHAIEGVCNSMAGIYNAYHGGGKIAFVVGRAATDSIACEGLWYDDMVPLSQNHTKWSFDVRDTRSIPMIIRRLFKVISEPPPGPGLVSIPMDVLDKREDMEIPPAARVYKPAPDPVAVEKAAAMLANAKNPVIYVGDRVAQSRAVPEAVQLAEMLGARVYASAMTELNFPMNHPLYAGMDFFGGRATAKILEDVDVVLFVGTNLGSMPRRQDKPPYPPDIRMVQLDCSSWEIAKNYPIEMGIISDCKAGLRDLASSVRDHMTPAKSAAASQRVAEITRKTTRRNKAAEKKAEAGWNSVPISLPRFMTEVKKGIEPGTIIVTEAISAQGSLYQFLAPSEPGTYFNTPGGALGWGMPATLGAKLGAPDRPVVGLIGDGSSLYAIQALWTAAHYNIPATYVIINNYRYDTLRLVWGFERGKEPRYEDISYYVDLDNPKIDFVKMAESYGLRGTRVTKPEDLSGAIKAAQKSGEPSLIDVGVQIAQW